MTPTCLSRHHSSCLLSRLLRAAASLSFLLLLSLASPSRAYAWKFAAYGDTRTTHSAHYKNVRGILDRMPNSERVTIVNSGDVVANGTSGEWNTFKEIVNESPQYPASLDIDWYENNPPEYIAAPGNHDKNNSSWVGNWANVWHGLKNVSAYSGIQGNPDGLYGSVKYDNAIWIWVVDVKQIPSGQEAFLENTLIQAAADPQVTWKFVIFHRPPVACGGGHGDTASNLKWHDDYFVPYGVDIIFVGHNHHYERTCPFLGGLYGGSRNCDSAYRGDNINGDPEGVIHIITGGGGATLYQTGDCAWLEAAAMKHHFMEFDIQGGVLNAKVWEVDSWNPDGGSLGASNLIDEFTITKGPVSTPTPTSTPSSSYDLDGNGQVNAADALILLGGNQGDFNSDGRVNSLDFSLLAANWGT